MLNIGLEGIGINAIFEILLQQTNTTATINSLNPFVANVVAGSGVSIIAGNVNISIMAKPNSHGNNQVVSGNITSQGLVTENVAGSFFALLDEAGYLNGDVPYVSITINTIP